MSSERKDCGRAFPVCIPRDFTEVSPGMSLRDYFAAKAMQGLIAMHSPQARVISEQIAEGAYRVADAMLKAREQ